MKRFALFALVCAVLVGGLAAGVVAVYGQRLGEDGARAVVMSAGIAFTVQCLTFGIWKALMPLGVWMGWLMTVGLRFLVVIGHGVIGAPLLGLPMTPALLSLAAFIFMTSVIEPLFLFTRSPLPPPQPPAPPAT
jgi:hypothetical protein